jgi:hypothetical protein
MSSEPEIFIVESLRIGDEKKEKFEGKILRDMLKLQGKDSIYYYLRTKQELIKILKEFSKSDYRYLHISCHANDQAMDTTFDTISFSELGEILESVRNEEVKRRIFLSACEMASPYLAVEIIPKSHCKSILGPSISPRFDQAAIFWSSFYYLMFKKNPDGMNDDDLVDNAEIAAKMVGMKLNFFKRTSFKEKKGKKIYEFEQIEIPRIKRHHDSEED